MKFSQNTAKRFFLTCFIVLPRTATMAGLMVLLSERFFIDLHVSNVLLISFVATLFAISVFWVYGITRWKSTWNKLSQAAKDNENQKESSDNPRTWLKYPIYIIVILGGGFFVGLNGYIAVSRLLALLHVYNPIIMYILGSICATSIIAIAWTYVLQHTKKNIALWEGRLRHLDSINKNLLVKTILLSLLGAIKLSLLAFFITYSSLNFFPFLSVLNNSSKITIAMLAAVLYGLVLIVSKGGNLYEMLSDENKGTLTNLPLTRWTHIHRAFGTIYTVAYSISDFSGVMGSWHHLGIKETHWFLIAFALGLTLVSACLEFSFTTIFLFKKRTSTKASNFNCITLTEEKIYTPKTSVDNKSNEYHRIIPAPETQENTLGETTTLSIKC